MSTDVYFDFYSAEYAPLMRACYDGKPEYTLMRALEQRDGRDAHHDVSRVAYLSNLLIDCNFDAWVAFEEQWAWVEVTAENIPLIVSDWKFLYDNSQKPENAKDCMPHDILTPEDVQVALQESRGRILNVRTD